MHQTKGNGPAEDKGENAVHHTVPYYASERREPLIKMVAHQQVEDALEVRKEVVGTGVEPVGARCKVQGGEAQKGWGERGERTDSSAEMKAKK